MSTSATVTIIQQKNNLERGKKNNMVKKTQIATTQTQNEGEGAAVFYKVDEKNTLSYITKQKGAWYEIEVPAEDMHVKIQKGGNIKTGKEWLLNTLPGEKPLSVKGNPITNMQGTCIGVCDGCEKFCYAINGAQRYHNTVMPSVIQNTIIYRANPEQYEAEVVAELKNWKDTEKVFRWHSSGEIEDYAYLEMMMRVAERFPDVHFYSYTKRFKMIEKYLDEHEKFPENFVWNLSVWGDNLKQSGFNEKYLPAVQRFEWKDSITKEEYNKSIHCRSVVHDGGKKGHLDHDMNCRKCGLCWKGKCKGRTIFVYNH